MFQQRPLRLAQISVKNLFEYFAPLKTKMSPKKGPFRKESSLPTVFGKYYILSYYWSDWNSLGGLSPIEGFQTVVPWDWHTQNWSTFLVVVTFLENLETRHWPFEDDILILLNMGRFRHLRNGFFSLKIAGLHPGLVLWFTYKFYGNHRSCLGCGNSNICIFTPKHWGRFPFWRAYFSKGLVQPTTS